MKHRALTNISNPHYSPSSSISTLNLFEIHYNPQAFQCAGIGNDDKMNITLYFITAALI